MKFLDPDHTTGCVCIHVLSVGWGQGAGKRLAGMVSLIDIIKHSDFKLSGNISTLTKNITNTVKTFIGVQLSIVRNCPIKILATQLAKKIKTKKYNKHRLIQVEEEWLSTRCILVK